MKTSLDYAIEYWLKGYSIMPIGGGEKKILPLIHWKEYQERLPTLDEIVAWWTKWPDAGIGIICGKVSGISVIDVDLQHGGSPDGLPDTRKAQTQHGGWHYHYQYLPGFSNKGGESGQKYGLPKGIDIRTDGGFVAAPPTKGLHGEYKWINWEDGLAPYPEAFIPKRAEITYEVKKEFASSTTSQGERPGDDFNKRSTWDEVLCPHGWVLSQERGEKSFWTRPGRGGGVTSATTNYKGCGLLYVFSTNADPFENEATYDKFAAYAVLNHEGNFARAAAELSTQGYGIKRQQTTHATKKEAVETSGFKMTTSEEDYQYAMTVFLTGKARGLSTGFDDLDRLTGGLITGQSYLIFADTSVGKSIFAVNILVGLAMSGVKCLYFDLENSMDMSMERLMFAVNNGGIDLKAWRSAKENKDSVFIEMAMNPLKKILPNFKIWELTGLTNRFGDITWEGVRKCVQEGIEDGVQVIVLDHLHYFSPAETDHAVLAEVARELNNLCAVNNLVILAVAHTKKGLVYAKDGQARIIRPTIDSINGSSLISKHFKNVIGMSRNVAADSPQDRRLTKIYVDKTKYGPSGSFTTNYNEDSLIFYGALKNVLLQQDLTPKVPPIPQDLTPKGPPIPQDLTPKTPPTSEPTGDPDDYNSW